MDCSLDTSELELADVELHEPVGDGRTATVFRATRHSKEVAVKQMRFKSADKAILRELAVMRSIHHRQLVAFIGIVSKVDHIWIVMEYCRGNDLFQLLHLREDEVCLSWVQKLTMAKDTAEGMRFLHQHDPQIIHRDLKSLNLLLKDPVESELDIPQVKITDFGLSRMKEVTRGSGQVFSSVMTRNVGTSQWMAPEVFSDNRYSAKVDVYSYAVVLFEVICRELPFEGVDAAKIGLLVMEGQRPDMDAVPPDCPEAFVKLMIDCWADDPSCRPPFEAILETVKTILVDTLCS